MRKIIGIILLLTQFSCAKHPQDSLTFKIKYQSETKYNQTTERTTQTVIKYAGPEKSLLKLRSMGVRNPNTVNRKTQTESVLKTGKMNGENFSISLEYIKTISSDGIKEVPDGDVLNGMCLLGKNPKFNSVESAGLDEKYKPAILQSVQNAFSQFSFPEKKLKIGEEFAVESSRSMPMDGSKIEITIITHYKLIRILNDIASFDISQEYLMNSVLINNSFKGTGNGKGEMVYDIVHTIILSYTLNTEMEIYKKLDSFEFNLKAMSGFIQTTKLAK